MSGPESIAVRKPRKRSKAEPIKPSRIVVKKLFGRYNHDIKLHQDSRITILIGINGTGKTTILRMINQVSQGDFLGLHKEPFGTFRINFGKSLYEFSKQKAAINARYRSNPRTKWKTYRIPVVIPSKLDERIQFLMHRIRLQENILRHRGRDEDNEKLGYLRQELMELEHMMDRYQFQYTSKGEQEIEEGRKPPRWLNDFLTEFNCHLIPARRLFRLLPEDERTGSMKRKEKREGFAEAISIAADKLSLRIRRAQREHSRKSLALNQNFLDNVFRSLRQTKTFVSWEAFSKQLDDIEAIEQKLMSTGLIKRTRRTPLPDDLKERWDDPVVAGFLDTYIKGSKAMYSVFAELLDKTTLFTEIVNNHLSEKQIIISADDGFSVALADGSELDLSKLSSGEQQFIVLSFELIFQTPKGSLVLIDEPELSLHVAWQQDFKDDLRMMGAAQNLIFLLATHSPSIVDREWDICHELSL